MINTSFELSLALYSNDITKTCHYQMYSRVQKSRGNGSPGETVSLHLLGKDFDVKDKERLEFIFHHTQLSQYESYNKKKVSIMK